MTPGSGAVTDFHREHMGEAEYLEGLEVLEYDLLYGDRIAYDGVSPYRETEMTLGLEPIRVTGADLGEPAALIQGEGFTEWSVVYVNGRRREDTEYVSPELLLLPDENGSLSPEDRIEVCQTGPDRIVLSSAAWTP